jgi:hypothetical protein
MAGTGSAGSAARGILRGIVFLALLGAVGWLLSERNARTWQLAPQDGRLVVKRGLFLPLGSAEYRPSDAAAARAYAPLVPPPGKALPEAREFAEQAELDRAIYDLVAAWAREDIASGDPTRLERGLGFLDRALQLPALSTSQREDLASLRAESGYFEARRLIDRARAELGEAAQKLRFTAGSRSRRASDADALLRELAPALDATAAAARVAGAAALPAAEEPPPQKEQPKHPPDAP